ncbi:hypothetical protein FVE85_2540 [Porphyridium purpureum]|uniref:Uncharacterized protein n=1 Tax=Porphyridium purpureum TaxID=35688 RepID=A0A5J4YKB2_PORPP|nr:hypothetical protein FVE85_2540 [Porphyridium purpureum]|eukprot:POR5945..scf291_13
MAGRVSVAHLRSLVVDSVGVLRARLRPGQRVLGVSPSAGLVNLSLSDARWEVAATFGVVSRGARPEHEARIIADALHRAPSMDPNNDGFQIGACVVGVRVPVERGWQADEVKRTARYVEELLMQISNEDKGAASMQGMHTILYWNEADVVERAIRSARDFGMAARLAGTRHLRIRKLKIQDALFPRSLDVANTNKYQAQAAQRISAAEVLQVALDEMHRERRQIELAAYKSEEKGIRTQLRRAHRAELAAAGDSPQTQARTELDSETDAQEAKVVSASAAQNQTETPAPL